MVSIITGDSGRWIRFEEVDSRQLKVESKSGGTLGCDLAGLGRSGAAPARGGKSRRDREQPRAKGWLGTNVGENAGTMPALPLRRIERGRSKRRPYGLSSGLGTVVTGGIWSDLGVV